MTNLDDEDDTWVIIPCLIMTIIAFVVHIAIMNSDITAQSSEITTLKADNANLRDKLDLLETSAREDIPENLMAAIGDRPVIANVSLVCLDDGIVIDLRKGAKYALVYNVFSVASGVDWANDADFQAAMQKQEQTLSRKPLSLEPDPVK